MTKDVDGCDEETKELWGGQASGADEAERLLEEGKNVEAAARARMAIDVEDDPERD